MAGLQIGKQRYVSGEKSLTPGEFQKLMGVVGVLEHELLIKLAVATGIRRDDIVGIRIADIDFQERKIKFYEHKKRRIKDVFVNDEMILLITKHLNTLPKGREMLFSIKGRQAYNILQKYCDLSGIGRRPFHALRATCIKFCQIAGWTPEQAARHVGDKLETIQEHYTVPSESELKELANKKKVI